MTHELLASALDEAVSFGPAARLVLTFPGNDSTLHLHPLTYNRIGEGGFRIEVRVSTYDDNEVVDDVIFVDAASVETVELQIKEKGKVWHDEPYAELDDDGPP